MRNLKKINKNLDAKLNMRKNKYYKKIRHQESGVTITSLVVTIIVLLILAGITIKFALDDNGIIKQSRLASEKYQNKALQEQLALNQAEKEITEAANSAGSGGTSSGGLGNQTTGGGTSSGDSGSTEDTDELKRQIEDLQSEVDSLTAQIQKEQEEKAKLQQQVNDLNKQLNETNNTITDLKNQIKDKDNKISDLTKEKGDLENQINTLKSKQATGNATASQVLAGATFSTSSGIGLTGTMVNRTVRTGDVQGMNSNYSTVPTWDGTWLQYSQATNGVNRISICPPEGYYPGNGMAYVGANASEFGDASASDVASGKTFTSKEGLKITGTAKVGITALSGTISKGGMDHNGGSASINVGGTVKFAGVVSMSCSYDVWGGTNAGSGNSLSLSYSGSTISCYMNTSANSGLNSFNCKILYVLE